MNERRFNQASHHVRSRRRSLLLVVVFGVVTGAGAIERPPAPVPQRTSATAANDAVLDALLHATDAQSAIAVARSLRSDAATTKTRQARSAATEYAAAEALLATQVRAARSVGAAEARAALSAAAVRWKAAKLLLGANDDRTGRALDDARLPSLARDRAQAHRNEIAARLGRIAALIESASPARGNAAEATLQNLDDVLQAVGYGNRTPIYGAGAPPLHRPHLAPREPVESPTIVPSYANAVDDVMPRPADYASTPDAPQSQAVLAKAQTLGNDYTRIFDFVRGQIRTEWYAGAQKGAEGTLRDGAGNDVDQASLLIALLRASGAPSRYVSTVVDVPLADLAASLGVRSDKVGQALTAAGVPNRPIVRAGRIAAFAIDQTIVSTLVPFSNYRGTSADRAGKTWIPLAPAIKPHRFRAATGALARAGITSREFVADYLVRTQSALPLPALRQRVVEYLAAQSPPLNYDDQLADRGVDATPLEVLPASLPVATIAVVGEFAVLPEGQRQHIRIVVRQAEPADGTPLLDASLPVADVVDRRVTLTYLPATPDDARIADFYGGIGPTPPYLIHLRPQVHVGGQPVAMGTGTSESGASLSVQLTISGPAGQVALEQTIVAGGVVAIAIDAQADTMVASADTAPLPADSETRAMRVLSNLGARYVADWNLADAELARLVGASVVRPFPSVALVINQYRVERVAGVVEAMRWTGVALDAALRPAEPIAQSDENVVESDWLRYSALHGSALEHRVFEQQWAVDSVSADKGLQIARGGSVPVMLLTPGSSVDVIGHPTAVRESIAAWLARGYSVEVPRDPIAVHEWRGAVWRVESIPSGESGYFISGDLAGGSTALPPEQWYFPDLAALLGNPYAGEPSEDPLAGVMLVLDQSSQSQVGIAGSLLDNPLRAVVRDAIGRGVVGATVTFAVSRGNGKLLDETGQEASHVDSVTNRNGVAEARLKLGNDIGDFGGYVLDDEATYPQRVGRTIVEVSAVGGAGTLSSGEPFRADARPGPLTELHLVADSGDDKLVPGVGPYALHVWGTDQHDNSIANLAVSIIVQTEFGTHESCEASDFLQAKPTTVYAPGTCADRQILGPDACGTESASIETRSMQTLVFASAANVPDSHTTILASTGGIDSEPLTLETVGNLNAGCSPSLVEPPGEIPYNAVSFEWGLSSSGHYTNLYSHDTIVDAMKPNELMPIPRRISNVHVGPNDGATVTWVPDNDVAVDFQIEGATAEQGHMIGGGNYEYQLRGGPTPRTVDGFYSIRSTTGQAASTTFRMRGAWVVQASPPTLEPSRVPLTPFGATAVEARINAQVEPTGYRATVMNLQTLKNGEVLDDVRIESAGQGQSVVIPRGSLIVQPNDVFTSKMVLNDGTPFRMESTEGMLSFGRGLIGGYGLIDMSNTRQPTDVSSLIQSRLPKHISIAHEVDFASGYACAIDSEFAYFLEQDAHVSLAFYRLDANGTATAQAAWQPLDNVQKTSGLNELPIDSSALPFGAFQFKFKAVASDGTVEEREGTANHVLVRHDTVTLAHPFVKGVDLFSGGALLSETDISVDGRGPGMALTRAYASHRGHNTGLLGRGWTTELDVRVIKTSCNDRIVTGFAGQGQRFTAAGLTPDGAQRFEPTSGYHGTLLQRGDDYDFYGKDGTRHHFGRVDIHEPRMLFVEDTDGNRVSYEYDVADGVTRVVRILDSSGRQLDLDYQLVAFRDPFGAYTIDSSELRLKSVRGPLGALVRYEYGGDGNLARVTRTGTGGGEQRTEFRYINLGGMAVLQSDGKLDYEWFGNRLQYVTNVVDGSRRQYEYGVGWSIQQLENDVLRRYPEQRVKRLHELDGGVTNFVYDGERGMAPVATDVTDARNATTHYEMNRYGAAEVVTDFAGTTRTQWDFTAYQPSRITDALGTTTDFLYDDQGNKTHETVTHPTAGVHVRQWSFVPQSEFDPPYIKNRTRTFVDARGVTTTYGYDLRGHRTSTARGGMTERDTYAPNGDRSTHSDGTGATWQLRYDTYGYLRETTDPMNHVTSATWDALGRQLTSTDANGNTTTTDYDALDRVVRVVYPTTDAGQAVVTTSYDDAQRRITVTDARGFSTVTSNDPMGRRLAVTTPDSIERFSYDLNGNLLSHRDEAGGDSVFIYDAANRLREKHEPEQRTTLYEVDALGHVLSETVSGGASAARTTTYRYDDPAYKRTEVKRTGDASTGGDAIEQFRYDGNGNAIEHTDAEQRTSTSVYDDRGRLHVRTEPLGRVTTLDYDAADRPIVETRSNPGGSGAQVRRHEYDAAGRRVASTDAEGGMHTQTYDAAGNVISSTDARGNLTRFVYDARNLQREEIGPEAGQRRTFVYDRSANRTEVHEANGRVVIHGYDGRNRRISTNDQLGSVETLTYWPDGRVKTRTDADGHTTSLVYDGLRRLIEETLPPVEGQPRIHSQDWNIHGDLIRDVDPERHETLHAYDALGRRTVTTLPAVAGATASLVTTYDRVGNVLSQTNARQQRTDTVVDALNRRIEQTDPPDADGERRTQHWTYDALGNTLTHTDRRGVVSVSAYDRENRRTGHSRDGQVVELRRYDAQGNVVEQTDALRRKTAIAYDKANRPFSTERPLGAIESTTYTPLGDIASITNADGETTTRTYDLRRRLDSETNPAGETTHTTYDGEGHRTSVQRALGADTTWTYTYDAAGRLASVTDPETGTTTYRYDRDGNRTQVTDANDHVTQWTYDARHRLTRKTYPDTQQTTWQHDPDGNVTVTLAPNGRRTETTYDALNRPLVSTYVGAPAGEVTTRANHYDANGNVTRIDETIDGTTRTQTRRYDTFDRLEEAVASDGSTVTYFYDAVGNRVRRIDDQETRWTYDALNRNSDVTITGQGTTQIDYTLTGRPTRVTQPDGSTSATDYDAAGRIVEITHTKAATPVAVYRYRYDLNGNRTEQQETNGGPLTTTTYDYDKADRLVRVTEPDRTTTYTLDPVGNRDIEHVTNATGQTISHSVLTYNDRDQLTDRTDTVLGLSVHLTYDENGNERTRTTNGQVRTSTYDARDRLITLSQPNAPPLTFDYDSDGLRTRKTSGATETRYRYDEDSLRAETNAIGNPTARYHYSATQLLSRTDEGSTPQQRHYLLDALQSPIALLTQEGAVSARTRYDAWGEVIAQQGTSGQTITPNRDQLIAELPITDGQPLGYTGYIKDTESGLYYAKARYYDPTTARFTTEDPEAGKDLQPPSLHRYLYAYANPTVYVDTNGRQSVDSQRYALLQTLNMAGNPAEKELAARMVRDYDAAVRARANPEATGIANSFAAGTEGLVQLAADVLYTIPEAALPDSMDLGSRVRLGAFFTAMMSPIDTIAEGDRRIRYEGAQLRKAGDEFGARERNAEANTNVVAALLGGRTLLRSGANFASTTMAKIANRGGAAVAVEGNGFRFYDPAIIEELEEAYSAAGRSRPPTQLEVNKAAGNAFESEIELELVASHDIVAPQVTIRTATGIRTRVDFVTLSGTTIGCVECKASSTAPLTKNQSSAFPEIMQSGGVVVGKGKPGVPKGTIIPAGTEVKVRRKEEVVDAPQ